MNIYQVWGLNRETNKKEYLGAFLNRGAAEIDQIIDYAPTVEVKMEGGTNDEE
jgi:hypothetical protein